MTKQGSWVVLLTVAVVASALVAVARYGHESVKAAAASGATQIQIDVNHNLTTSFRVEGQASVTVRR
jgi:hypothetical protein